MNNSKEGAFATSTQTTEHTEGYWQAGLTKREYFASLALQGLLGNPCLINLNLNPMDSMKDHVVVEYSVRMADELLKQLES